MLNRRSFTGPLSPFVRRHISLGDPGQTCVRSSQRTVQLPVGDLASVSDEVRT